VRWLADTQTCRNTRSNFTYPTSQLAEKCLRRIHRAVGVSIDTINGRPRSRALGPRWHVGGRLRLRPLHNAVVVAVASGKPIGMLDAVGGTQKVTARPAGRGGRGARERILAAATTLFHREGIHTTGVERLTQYAHVSKRTFYQHFSSKNALVEEYLRRIHHAGGAPSEQAIDTADASPRGRLLAIFDGAPVSRFRGCPFHNAAVEAADAMPGVEDIVHEHKLDFTARLIHRAAEAGARDPYRLGNQLAVLFEGAKALATSLNDTSPLLHARSAAETLIDAATTDSRR
jgi:AcrR family transcriptional regulator